MHDKCELEYRRVDPWREVNSTGVKIGNALQRVGRHGRGCHYYYVGKEKPSSCITVDYVEEITYRQQGDSIPLFDQAQCHLQHKV